MRDLSPSATKEDVTIELAKILHHHDYLELWGSIPVDLEVQLHQKNKEPGAHHSGTGRFTVAVESVARRFLQDYGGVCSLKAVQFSQRTVIFQPSINKPAKGIIAKFGGNPYVDPRAEPQKQRRIAEAEAKRIPISRIEFGWECRDTIFSSEWGKPLDPSGFLGCDEDRREFRVEFGSKVIVLRFAQINWASCGMDGASPVICFNLDSAPIFEETFTILQSNSSPFTRTRISSLDSDHERVVAYTSLAVRFICNSKSCLQTFRELCSIVNFRALSDGTYHKEDRQLFSVELEQQLGQWLEQLDFEVAFQVEKIVRDALVDFQEILAIKGAVEDLVRSRGVGRAVGVLRSFQFALREYAWEDRPNHIPTLFLTTSREHVPEIKSLADTALEGAFWCHRVSVTPTTMKFSGPFLEQSNRVFRRYRNDYSCFIRVTFEEETRLQLRFDREVDGATFVRKRYGTILREKGLKIGGRMHRFLAYSQSALKDHSVWFMRSFENKDGDLVDTAYIIKLLGDFSNARDPNLIRCPGRYGARISQAFTSTDPGVSIEPEEIREVPDIEVLKTPGGPPSGPKWNFTDGVGTLSSELSNEIIIRLSGQTVPPVCSNYQVRFKGCKVSTFRWIACF